MTDTGKKQSKKKSADEVELPDYPAIYRCLLVDARMGSRTELLKDVKASGLFEVISEAPSLKDAFGIVQYEQLDACVIGPGVSTDRACEFIRRGKEKAKSTDCAFVAVLNRIAENVDEQKKQLSESGIHGIIEIPGTKRAFTEGVVRAVIAANKNSPWRGIRLKWLTDNEIKDDALGAITLLVDDASGESLIANVFRSATSDLKDILYGIDAGHYRLGPDGSPTPMANSAINKLITTMINSSSGAGDREHYRTFLDEAINQWFIDLCKLTNAEANENLRNRLVAFSEKRPA